MDTGGLRALLRDFTAVPGISGHEDAMAAAFQAALRDSAAETRIDALANVVARLPSAAGSGPGKRIALLAHLDTVGLKVKRRAGEGLAGVVRVGGVNLKAAPGAAVRVGDQPGVVSVRNQHQARPGEGLLSEDDLIVEFGMGEPAIGTPVTFAPQTVEMDGGFYASPSLDDRAGCAILIETARLIAGRTPHEIWIFGTAQEETTCAGAVAALEAVRPDVAIFVDGTVSYDTPDTRNRGETALGRGPVLLDYLYVSGLNGWHAHPGLLAHVAAVAGANAIGFQRDSVIGLMTDARAVQPLAIPSALIGVPMRGMHGPLETVHLGDMTAAVELLVNVLLAPLPDLSRGVSL